MNSVAARPGKPHRWSMAQDEAPTEVPATIRRHVAEVLDHLLSPGELEWWECRWEPDDGRWLLVVEVVACGEHHRGFVAERGAGYPVEQGLDTFTDGLEDFISESRFAWGEQRLMKDRPWREQ